jgi:hypothetical protein
MAIASANPAASHALTLTIDIGPAAPTRGAAIGMIIRMAIIAAAWRSIILRLNRAFGRQIGRVDWHFCQRAGACGIHGLQFIEERQCMSAGGQSGRDPSRSGGPEQGFNE